MDTLAYLSARALAARIRRRELTAVDAVEAQLARIEKHGAAVNAVVSADPEAARRAAAEADAAQRRGAPIGPLHGVPITLKDAHDVAGLRTTIGTEVFDRVPATDGAVAARLRAAGAIVLGHTNVPAFLADYVSANDIFGRTANPWDTDRTPGGSSGGAAAALAAGLTPLEVGSDLAGSLRVPAHFCGVYGLKATEHRIPTTGFFRPPDGTPGSVRILNSLGPMARDLDDLALALRLIAGPDGVDTDVPPVPLPARQERALPSLRLAWAPALPDTTVAPALRDQVTRVAAAAADAGATVAAHLPALDWQDQWVFGELMAVTEVFAPGATPKALDWYFEALARRDRWITAWERFFDDYDALLLPPASSTAFHHDATGTDQQGLQCVFANLAGLPALTVPAGHDEHGLPVGIQIVGPRWAEIRLLDVAAALEAAAVLPGFTAPPAYGPGDPDTSAAVAMNRRTVAAYEEYAPTYAESTAPGPSGPSGREGLRRLADLVGPGGAVLEIGSGPGWDADYLETLGVAVRRTDVTAKFVELQAGRGRKAALVDVISDPLGGPYDGVVALCVLQHIEHEVTDAVLRKVSGALRAGGGFLVSIREGSGDHWEGSTGAYRVVLRQHDEFVGRLAAAGLAVDWTVRQAGTEGTWLTFLATRRSPAPPRSP